VTAFVFLGAVDTTPARPRPGRLQGPPPIPLTATTLSSSIYAFWQGKQSDSHPIRVPTLSPHLGRCRHRDDAADLTSPYKIPLEICNVTLILWHPFQPPQYLHLSLNRLNHNEPSPLEILKTPPIKATPWTMEWSRSFLVLPGAPISKELSRGGGSKQNRWFSSRLSPTRKCIKRSSPAKLSFIEHTIELLVSLWF
jgi:hypothetical protein